MTGTPAARWARRRRGSPASSTAITSRTPSSTRELLDTNDNAYNFSAAYANPQSRLDFSPRLDIQLGRKEHAHRALHARPRRCETNSGVSQFALQSQAYNVTNYENTLQVERHAGARAPTRSMRRGSSTLAIAITSRRRTLTPPSRCRARLLAAETTWVWCATTRTASSLENDTTVAHGPACDRVRRAPPPDARRQLLHIRLQRQLHLLLADCLRGGHALRVHVTAGQGQRQCSAVRRGPVLPGRFQGSPELHPQLWHALRDTEPHQPIMTTGRRASASPGLPSVEPNPPRP